MPKTKEPVDLIVLKGRKHLTKSEIDERRKTEVKAPVKKPRAPEHLSDIQKKKFNKLAKELFDIEIIAALDADILEMYVDSYFKYKNYNKLVSLEMQKVSTGEAGYTNLTAAEGLRDKAFRQCRNLANDLGLTITSRCRLVIPKAAEPPRENKFTRFAMG